VQQKAAYDRKWLLSSITDTQSTANTVDIAYEFAPIEQGYAHRPSNITYAGYEVDFHY